MTNMKPMTLTATCSFNDLKLAWEAAHLGAQVYVLGDLGQKIELKVTGLEHEDGSGKSILVKGQVLANHLPGRVDYVAEGQHVTFEAYFNFKGGDRKGWIKICHSS